MDSVPIWSHLKPAREAQNKTAADVGEYVGVGADMIYRFEAGRTEFLFVRKFANLIADNR